jgi:hypothetical protein
MITSPNNGERHPGAIGFFLEIESLDDPLVATDKHGSPVTGTCDAAGVDIGHYDLQFHCRVVEGAETAILERHQEGRYLRIRAEDHGVDPVVRDVWLTRPKKLQVKCVPDKNRMYAVADGKKDPITGREKAGTVWWVKGDDGWPRRVVISSVTSEVLP